MTFSHLWPGLSRFVKCFSPVLSNIIIVKIIIIIIIIIIIVIVELSHMYLHSYGPISELLYFSASICVQKV